jgi:pSer/pThr/pTyr-binding forkhead associated (FHA) protein
MASDVYSVGRLFELRLNKKTIGWVGRSSSKKFRQHGLSLSKDLEVSTTHGKFFVNSDDGRVYYTDTGSTNGSKMDGSTLQVDVPYLVENGTRLLLGATELQLTIL